MEKEVDEDVSKSDAPLMSSLTHSSNHSNTTNNNKDNDNDNDGIVDDKEEDSEHSNEKTSSEETSSSSLSSSTPLWLSLSSLFLRISNRLLPTVNNYDNTDDKNTYSTISNYMQAFLSFKNTNTNNTSKEINTLFTRNTLTFGVATVVSITIAAITARIMIVRYRAKNVKHGNNGTDTRGDQQQALELVLNSLNQSYKDEVLFLIRQSYSNSDCDRKHTTSHVHSQTRSLFISILDYVHLMHSHVLISIRVLKEKEKFWSEVKAMHGTKRKVFLLCCQVQK